MESLPHRRQKKWKKGEREEKFCHPLLLTWAQLLAPAGFHRSVKVGAVVKPTFYSLTMLISGLVRQSHCHISSRGQETWKAASNPLILPCSQGVTPGCAHKPPRRGDNSFPDSFLSKDRLSRDIWSVTPHPRRGLVWGAGPPQLFSSIWAVCPHYPMATWRHLFHGRARSRGEVGCVALGCLPGFVCLLAESLQSVQSCDAAVNLHHQQLQTSCFKSIQEDPTLSVGSVLT